MFFGKSGSLIYRFGFSALVVLIAAHAAHADPSGHGDTIRAVGEAASIGSAQYELERADDDSDRFIGHSADIVSDDKLIRATKEKTMAIARQHALEKAYANCEARFSDCRELRSKVLQVTVDDVEMSVAPTADEDVISVEKHVRIAVRIVVDVAGQSKAGPKPQRLPSQMKRPRQLQYSSSEAFAGSARSTLPPIHYLFT